MQYFSTRLYYGSNDNSGSLNSTSGMFLFLTKREKYHDIVHIGKKSRGPLCSFDRQNQSKKALNAFLFSQVNASWAVTIFWYLEHPALFTEYSLTVRSCCHHHVVKCKKDSPEAISSLLSVVPSISALMDSFPVLVSVPDCRRRQTSAAGIWLLESFVSFGSSRCSVFFKEN
jgi:hypothetical protein